MSIKNCFFKEKQHDSSNDYEALYTLKTDIVGDREFSRIKQEKQKAIERFRAPRFLNPIQNSGTNSDGYIENKRGDLDLLSGILLPGHIENSTAEDFGDSEESYRNVVPRNQITEIFGKRGLVMLFLCLKIAIQFTKEDPGNMVVIYHHDHISKYRNKVHSILRLLCSNVNEILERVNFVWVGDTYDLITGLESEILSQKHGESKSSRCDNRLVIIDDIYTLMGATDSASLFQSSSMSIQRLLFSLTRSCNATVLSINFSVNITNKKVIGTQIHNGSFIYAETRDSGVFGLSDIRVVNPDHSRQGQQQEQYQKSQDERENGVENGDDGDDGQNSSPKVFGLRHGLGSIWANYCHARIWVNCTEKIISPSYSIYNDLKIDYKISITERIHNSAENNDGENKDSWAPSVLALTLIDSSNSDATIDDEYLGYKGKTCQAVLIRSLCLRCPKHFSFVL